MLNVFILIKEMGSHKQRVQRKIKKDVKRKVQAKRQQQQRQQAHNNQMSELMKLMLMMKGDKQPAGGDQQEKIRLIEEKQKMKNELEKEKMTHKEEMEKMKNEMEEMKGKHKIKTLKENTRHQKAMNDEAKEQMDIEDETTSAKHKFELNEQKHKTQRTRSEGEHQTKMLNEKQKELMLDEEGAVLEAERRDAQHKLDTTRQEVEQIKKQMNIDGLKKQLKELYDNTTKTKTELNQYKDVDDPTILNLINQLNAHLTSIQNYASSDVVPLLKEFKETKTLANTLVARNLPQQLEQGMALRTALEIGINNATARLNYLKEMNDKVVKNKWENKKLENEAKSFENASTGIKLAKVEIVGKDGKKEYQFIPVEDAYANIKSQNAIKKKELQQAQNEFERKSNKVLETDKIDDENKDMQAEINHLAKLQIDDMTEKLAELKLNRDQLTDQKNRILGNKKYKAQINDQIKVLDAEVKETTAYIAKLNAKPDTPVKISEIANLKYKKKQLEDEMDSISVSAERRKEYEKQIQKLKDDIAIKTAEVAKLNESNKNFDTPKLLKSYGEAHHDLENTERDRDKAMKERKRVQDLEDKTDEATFQNKIDTAVLDAKDSQALTDAETSAIKSKVQSEQQKLINANKRKTIDNEREARAQAKEVEILGNDKEIQESNEKIENELALQEIHKQRMKVNEELKNKMNETRIKQATYNAMNKAGNALKPLDDGIIKVDAYMAGVNHEIDKNMDVLKSDEEFVVDKQKDLRNRFSLNQQVELNNLNEYLDHRGKKLIRNQDDINKFDNRLSISALEQLTDIIAEGLKNGKNMEDVDNYEGVNELLEYFKNKDALDDIDDADFLPSD